MKSNTNIKIKTSKEIFAAILVLIIMISFIAVISAQTKIAEIAEDGLSFFRQDISLIVKAMKCVGIKPFALFKEVVDVIPLATTFSTAGTCAKEFATSKVTGVVTEGIIGKVNEYFPESKKVLEMWNQIEDLKTKGAKLEKGASIIVGKEGEVESAKNVNFQHTLQMKDIGNLIGKNINASDISVNGVILAEKDEETKVSTLKFDENGKIIIKVRDKEGRITKTLTYENIEKDGILKLNEKGEVIFAKITSAVDGTPYTFGSYEEITANKGAKILYENGIITVDNADKIAYGKRDIILEKQQFKIERKTEGDKFTDSFTGKSFRIKDVVSVEGLDETEGEVVSIKDGEKGWLVKKGTATFEIKNYEKIQVTAKNEKEETLVGERGEGNWIIADGREIKFNSAYDKKSNAGTTLNAKLLGGHSFTQNSNPFEIKVSDGNIETIKSRVAAEPAESKRIFINHQYAGRRPTEITSGGIPFQLSDKIETPPKLPELHPDKIVPFETNEIGGEKLVASVGGFGVGKDVKITVYGLYDSDFIEKNNFWEKKLSELPKKMPDIPNIEIFAPTKEYGKVERVLDAKVWLTTYGIKFEKEKFKDEGGIDYFINEKGGQGLRGKAFPEWDLTEEEATKLADHAKAKHLDIEKIRELVKQKSMLNKIMRYLGLKE